MNEKFCDYDRVLIEELTGQEVYDALEALEAYESVAPLEENQEKEDELSHYRVYYKGIQIDPARICKEYKINDMCMQIIIKKSLVAGVGRGHKSRERDLKDIINAAERQLAIDKEDG